MLATKNKGLAEAAEIMKRMSLGKTLRYYYEAHLKAVRDRYGEDAYVRDQGRAEGVVLGKADVNSTAFHNANSTISTGPYCLPLLRR